VSQCNNLLTEILKKFLKHLKFKKIYHSNFNSLNAELNPICHLLALLGTHHNLHISRIRVNKSTITVGEATNKGIIYTTEKLKGKM
jgi:hypothetical protein